MNKTVQDAIQKIIFIPRTFYLVGNKSWNVLVQESGYFQLKNSISESEISQCLIEYPELISDWLQWSDDQRCTPKIIFEQGESGRYHISRYPEGEQFEGFNSLDSFKACAYYIIRELENTTPL
jgi:hypothetical protein